MTRMLPVLACMALVTLCGCAGMEASVSEFMRAGPWWAAAQAGDIRSRARELEACGEFVMALDHWRLVQRIGIDQAEARGEIERMESTVAAAVQIHYQKGLVELRQKNLPAARNHFLTALRLDPGFQPAAKQINARFSPFPLAVYLSAPDDRPASVAKKVFGDEKKAFLVAWFNDLPENDALKPGTVLILPKLDKAPPRIIRSKHPPNRLAEAKARLAENDLEGALDLAGQADTVNPEVKALIHTIHLKKATAQIESGLLDDARQALATVPDGFAGKDAVMGKLTVILQKQQFTLDLATAQDHFDRGRYQQSLDRVEALLNSTPDSVDARDLAAEARYRVALDHFDHKRFLKAREVLEKADQAHEASKALKESVGNRLAELAQIHYRNGVKHFINEDLKSAIAEWEMALVCNPDHEKARENIGNARRLMHKIETLP